MDWIAGLPRHQAFTKYLLDEPSDWKKRFQDKLREVAYGPKGIPWSGMERNRQQRMADFINDAIYDRVGPLGFREELDDRNPRLPSRRRGGTARPRPSRDRTKRVRPLSEQSKFPLHDV